MKSRTRCLLACALLGLAACYNPAPPRPDAGDAGWPPPMDAGRDASLMMDAQDGALAPPEDSAVLLRGLAVSVGSLSPGFDPAVTSYECELPLWAAQVEITAWLPAQAELRIAGSIIKSGAAYRTPVLQVGDNIVDIEVTQPGFLPSRYGLLLRRSASARAITAQGDGARGFGWRVALSNQTLVIGSGYPSASGARVVEVWQQRSQDWLPWARLSLEHCAGLHGNVAIDGNVIVVGCTVDAEADGTEHAGSAYVFTRSADTWSAPTRLRASPPVEGEYFGESVAVSGDTIVVGAPFASLSDGHGGRLDRAGATYVFTREAGAWTQQARLTASNAGAGDSFGAAVCVRGDRLVASAPFEDSQSSGVNGNATDDSAVDSGAAYVFVRVGRSWAQEAYLKATRPDPIHSGDQFGGGDSLTGPALALWDDTLAIGAAREDLQLVAADADSDAGSDSAADVGAVYLFTRQDDTWTQSARLVPSAIQAGSYFGSSVGLARDRLLVGAWQHPGVGAGWNASEPASGSAPLGAAFSFSFRAGEWREVARLGATKIQENARFGWSVAISEHAQVVGAPEERASPNRANYPEGSVYIFP